MGTSFDKKNDVLVIKNVEVQTKGHNLVEKAAVELLRHSSIDVIVLEDVQDPAWMERLQSGKGGRRKWLPSKNPEQNNVYLTKEQVLIDFGESKRYRKKSKRYRKKSRRK